MKVDSQKSFEKILLDIGNKLQQLRIKKGYQSTAEFAAAHKLPPIQYWRMEKGKANVTLKSLNNVLAIHDLTVIELFAEGANGRGRKKVKVD